MSFVITCPLVKDKKLKKPSARLNHELAAYLERLSELPFIEDVKIVDAYRGDADAKLEVATPTGRVRLLVDLKRSHLSAEAVRQIDDLDAARSGWILFAPHVGAPLGAALEARGINFIDRSGNCHLRIGNRHVARIQGRPRLVPSRRIKPLRAPGYQVLFALLAAPELATKSIRDIASAAGTSRQAVVDTFARLEAEGYVAVEGDERKWTKRSRARLLDRWIEGYQTTVRSKLYYGRFRLRETGPDAVERQLESKLAQVRFGGTAGAHRLVGHYRGPSTVIHLEPSEAQRRALSASPTKGGELVWLAPLGTIGNRGETADTVHPLLIYAELCADPDPRSREVAERLRERYLP